MQGELSITHDLEEKPSRRGIHMYLGLCPCYDLDILTNPSQSFVPPLNTIVRLLVIRGERWELHELFSIGRNRPRLQHIVWSSRTDQVYAGSERVSQNASQVRRGGQLTNRSPFPSYHLPCRHKAGWSAVPTSFVHSLRR